MVCEAAMQIDRKGGQPSLQLSVEYHYEFTEEALAERGPGRRER